MWVIVQAVLIARREAASVKMSSNVSFCLLTEASPEASSRQRAKSVLRSPRRFGGITTWARGDQIPEPSQTPKSSYLGEIGTLSSVQTHMLPCRSFLTSEIFLLPSQKSLI